jgi:hypothetical protein
MPALPADPVRVLDKHNIVSRRRGKGGFYCYSALVMTTKWHGFEVRSTAGNGRVPFGT